MKKPYVTIVDDDSAFANYLRTFLSLRGYETRSYSRGDEMLAAVKQGDPPDIVLLDVMMPGMDGYQVLEVLRRDHSELALKVVMLTARTSDADIWHGWTSGVDYYMSKPFDPEELLRFLHFLADHTGSAAPTE